MFEIEAHIKGRGSIKALLNLSLDKILTFVSDSKRLDY